MSNSSNRASGAAFHAAHHRFAVLLACCTLLLLVAGALVTSNDAGLSVPDWPTSFGTFHMPRMVGGVKWEHGHRLVAATVGMLTIVLAVWTWMVDERRWMRRLGVASVAGIVFQGVLGGLTVLNFLPPAISTAHAITGQTMFCVLAAMALFTGRVWRSEPVLLTPDLAQRLKRLTAWLVGALYVQLTLGAAFRHLWTKWGPHAANRMASGDIIDWFLVPHVINAIVVLALIVVTTIVVFRHAGNHAELRRPSIFLHVLLLCQIVLGMLSLFARVVWTMDVPYPQPLLVIVTVGHLVVGAMLLATAVVLAIQVRRAAPALTERSTVAHASKDMVTA